MNGRQGVTALVSFSFDLSAIVVTPFLDMLLIFPARVFRNHCASTQSRFSADLAACFRIVEKISLSPSQECKMEAHAMAIRRKIFF
jgi:hypothetical protein